MVLVPQFAKRAKVVPQLISRVTFSPNQPNLTESARFDQNRRNYATSADGSLQGSPPMRRLMLTCENPLVSVCWYLLPFLEEQTGRLSRRGTWAVGDDGQLLRVLVLIQIPAAIRCRDHGDELPEYRKFEICSFLLRSCRSFLLLL
jgi:hypothetical protein